ncbi:MAG TPA: ATPase, T2SS/T4P/T4SS family, partial [Pseudomonadales bacterium]
MNSQRPASGQNRALDLRVFLDTLLADGHIAKDDLENVVNSRRGEAAHKMHPLAWIAEQNLDDLKNPGKKLDIETLTHKLAGLAGQPYYRIDPLSIDAAKVTQVMSYAFTQRFKIMAVDVTPAEVVIASAEPFITSWEPDLAHILRKPIRRVVANPVELQRLSTELYRLARSINYASSKGSNKAPGITNLEQMLEIGKGKDPEANDQHVVSIVDWLLQYAFDQRASDIHIEPRRDIGNVRFRIDGVMYTVYQMPMNVLSAVTSRIKALGRMNVAEKRRPQDG